ncbi:MAG: helix-turn-helix transcriptional regulator [Bacillota bacterium]
MGGTLLLIDIASRLKFLRDKRGMSIYRLAREAKVSQSFLSAIEAGQKVPTVTTLRKICEALGISLVEFFTDEPTQVPNHLRPLLDEGRRLKPAQVKKLAEFLASLKPEFDSVEAHAGAQKPRSLHFLVGGPRNRGFL